MKYSPARAAQYEKMEKMKLHGSILDIGGSRKSGYYDIIKHKGEIETVNLSEDEKHDHMCDLEKGLDIEDNKYDTVICFNVLEHIFNYQKVVDESYRVLKKDGKCHFTTPFLYRVHGAPDDYFRFTKSALKRIFTQAGYRDIKIEEISGGLFMGCPFLNSKMLRPNMMIVFIAFAKILEAMAKVIYGKIYKNAYKNNVVIYYLEARK